MAQTISFGVGVKVGYLNCTEAAKCNPVYKGLLLGKNELYEIPKNLTIETSSDLLVTLYEVKDDVEDDIMNIGVKGVKKLIDENRTALNVTLTFRLGRDGIMRLIKANTTIKRQIVNNAAPSNATENTNATSNKTKEFDENITFRLETNYTDPRPMNEDEFDDSLTKLDALEEKERNIKLRSEAKNNYESLIYSSRDWLKDEKNEMFIMPGVKDTILGLLEKV